MRKIGWIITLESMNDSKKFFVMDFIVVFCWLQRLGVKCDWMQLS